MLKKFAIVLSVAALSATVACSKPDSGVNQSVKSKLAADDVAVNPHAAATSGRDQGQTTTEKAASKTGEVFEDSAITADVKTKFLAEPGVSGLDIHVDTKNGVVTLSGNVNSKAEETKAISIARGSKGVKRVVNHMKLG